MTPSESGFEWSVGDARDIKGSCGCSHHCVPEARPKIGHEGETTRTGHPVRRTVSVQFSASRADSKFEKLRVPRTWKGVLFVGRLLDMVLCRR